LDENQKKKVMGKVQKAEGSKKRVIEGGRTGWEQYDKSC